VYLKVVLNSRSYIIVRISYRNWHYWKLLFAFHPSHYDMISSPRGVSMENNTFQNTITIPYNPSISATSYAILSHLKIQAPTPSTQPRSPRLSFDDDSSSSLLATSSSTSQLDQANLPLKNSASGLVIHTTKFVANSSINLFVSMCKVEEFHKGQRGEEGGKKGEERKEAIPSS